MTKLLIDNWMLQDVNHILEDGLSDEIVNEIIIDRPGDSHYFTELPYAVVQLDALFDLLTNIVLRDELIVDDRFTYVWENGHKSLYQLKLKSILAPFDFVSAERSIAEYRKSIVEELWVTTTLENVQRANEKSWELRKESVDNHMSQLIWGGAGYLARSEVYKTPYLGCPFRQALFRQIDSINVKEDAINNLDYVINTQRAKLFKANSFNRESSYARFSLHPVIIDVINESRYSSDFITVAIQLRERYKKIREWLGIYQDAIDTDIPGDINDHVKLLTSVANELNQNKLQTDFDVLQVNLSNTGIGISKMIQNPISTIRRRFGIRAMLTKMVFKEQGRNSLEKVFALFGIENTTLARQLHKKLVERYSSKM